MCVYNLARHYYLSLLLVTSVESANRVLLFKHKPNLWCFRRAAMYGAGPSVKPLWGGTHSRSL